jgi:predicted O-methyltransferase YrrM
MNSSLIFLVALNLAALVSIGVALAYVLHKVRRIHLKQFDTGRLAAERSDNLFTQIETLLALDKDLGLPAGLPPTRGWAGSPDFLRHLHRIATRLRPQTVVECSSGTSTVVLARSVQMNGGGHVYSLEHEPEYAQKTRDELQRQGLATFATVLDAPLRVHQLAGGEWRWYDTAGLPPAIDLLVIDGPPASTQKLARYPALPVLGARIAPTGRVVLDDAARPDELAALTRWESELRFVPDGRLLAEKGIAYLKRLDA